MATCPELLLSMQQGQATITACDIQIEALNVTKSAAQTQYWIDSMNYYLQGCGSGGGMMAAASTESVKVPTIEEVLNPPANVMAEIAKCQKLTLLLKLARLYFAKG